MVSYTKRVDRLGNLATKIICLECQKAMTLSRINDENALFFCPSCHNINLLADGLFIFLPQKYETRMLYQFFFQEHKTFFDQNELLTNVFLRKIENLPTSQKNKWEDNDVAYWDESYANSAAEQKIKDGNTIKDASLIPRDRYLFKYLRNNYQKNDFILEIGCGDAMTIRQLFPPTTFDCNFVISDYSLEALKYLKKILKNRYNVFCFQCLGNRLPFKDESLNFIISLGVLHHMPKKEKHLNSIIKKLKIGGFLLGYEPYTREAKLPGFGKYLIEKIFEPAHSAHEERINYWETNRIFKKYGEVDEYHEYSPLRTLMMKMFRGAIEHSQLMTNLCLLIDQLTIQTIGKIWRLFGPGAFFFVFKKS